MRRDRRRASVCCAVSSSGASDSSFGSSGSAFHCSDDALVSALTRAGHGCCSGLGVGAASALARGRRTRGGRSSCTISGEGMKSGAGTRRDGETGRRLRIGVVCDALLTMAGLCAALSGGADGDRRRTGTLPSRGRSALLARGVAGIREVTREGAVSPLADAATGCGSGEAPRAGPHDCCGPIATSRATRPRAPVMVGQVAGSLADGVEPAACSC
jgi:hypothetical protein